MEIGKLTPESFKKTCQTGQKSAAGLDGWSAAGLSILSDKAYAIIVDFLNAIEEDRLEWPEFMRHPRTVFLSKDPDRTDDP